MVLANKINLMFYNIFYWLQSWKHWQDTSLTTLGLKYNLQVKRCQVLYHLNSWVLLTIIMVWTSHKLLITLKCYERIILHAFLKCMGGKRNLIHH